MNLPDLYISKDPKTKRLWTALYNYFNWRSRAKHAWRAKTRKRYLAHADAHLKHVNYLVCKWIKDTEYADKKYEISFAGGCTNGQFSMGLVSFVFKVVEDV